MRPPSHFLHDIVALFGRPVAENPTQWMHERAFARLGLLWRYVTLEVAPEDLPGAVTGMRAMGFAGANCTIPHKIAVMPLLDEITSTARRIGAVNTIVRRPDRTLLGENTDGKGFMRAAREMGVEPRGIRAVILGAGGAARAIAFELAEAGARDLLIYNRGRKRGEELVRDIVERTPARAEFVPWEGRASIPRDAALVVNATSIGLFPNVDEEAPIDYGSIHSGQVACDVIPNPPETPFLRCARAAGAVGVDGLGMLVYQGAIAFKMWTGEEAPVDVMRAALEEVFAGSPSP